MVTATKRESSLQDTGIAISVLAADQLDFRDMKNLEDIENAVPGLKIGSILGTPLINIRGVGLNFISGLGNPGVATHYDGIYLPRAGSVGAASVDMATVEVLRGPQGTLYGRNSTGGSVNFISKKPGEEFAAGLTVGRGNYGREFYEAYIEGPAFTENMALRIFMRRDFFDGYGVNETSGKAIGGNDAVMGHIGLTFQPVDSVDVYLSYTRRDEGGPYPYSTALTPIKPILAGLEVAGLTIVPDDAYPTNLQSFEDYNIKGLREPSSDKFTDIGNLTVTWDINDYTLKSITGYVGHGRHERLVSGEIERFVVNLTRDETSNARSQEFNLSSNEWFDGRLNWLLGLYYQIDRAVTPYGAHIGIDEIAGTIAPLSTGLRVVYAPLSKTQDSTSAIYLDGYWSLLDNLRLVGGIRFSEEKRQLIQDFRPYIGDAANTPGLQEATAPFLRDEIGVFAYCEGLKTVKKFTSTDPKLGLEWDTTEDIMMYVQYQTGFKAGGFNTATSCNQFYDPEEIKSIEVGIKSTWLDNALMINAAAFNYDYTDYQVEKVVGFTSLIENAAAATSTGFEVEANYTATTWLALDAQYSYIDARYDSYIAVDNFKNSSVIAGDAPPENLSGNYLSRAPKNSVNLGVTFIVPVDRFGIGMAQFRIEGFYSSDVYFREFNRDIETQQEYSTWNAFLSFDSSDDRMTVSFFAKNIDDTRYQVGQIPFDTIKYYGAYYAPPKTVGASLALRF